MSRVRIVRTPANAVPVGGDAGSGFLPAIESAVAGGHLEEILVCGHSRCRALLAAFRSRRADRSGPETPAEDGQGRSPGRLIRGVPESAALLAEAKANVLVQLEALLGNPVIAGAVSRGTLALQGWAVLSVRLYILTRPG